MADRCALESSKEYNIVEVFSCLSSIGEPFRHFQYLTAPKVFVNLFCTGQNLKIRICYTQETYCINKQLNSIYGLHKIYSYVVFSSTNYFIEVIFKKWEKKTVSMIGTKQRRTCAERWKKRLTNAQLIILSKPVISASPFGNAIPLIIIASILILISTTLFHTGEVFFFK